MAHFARRTECLLIAAAISAVAPSAVEARTVSRPQHGYSIEVPDDWVEVPDAELRAIVIATQKTPGKNGMVWDIAFQPATPDRPWLAYPYMVVQILPYRGFGLQRQLAENEFRGFIAAMANLDMEKVAKDALTPEASKAINSVKQGVPRLDTAARRYFLPFATTMQDIGPVRGQAYGFFGHDAMVQIGAFSETGEWATFGPLGQRIADSFKFDATHQYNEQEASITRASNVGRQAGALVGRSVIPIIVSGLVGWCLVQYARRYRRRYGRPPSSPPPLP
jgi:hypothetical protein